MKLSLLRRAVWRRPADLRDMNSPGRSWRIERITRQTSQSHLQAIASLHVRELSAGVISGYGSSFMSVVYRALAQHQASVVLVAMANDHVVGFVSGTADLPGFRRFFLLRFGPAALAYLWRNLLSPSWMRSMLARWRFSGETDSATPSIAQLLSLAVDAQHTRQGIGAALFNGLVAEFRHCGLDEFRIAAAQSQQAALRFYPAMACRLMELRQVGQQTWSIYRFDLRHDHAPRPLAATR